MLSVLCSIFKVDEEYILSCESDDGVGVEDLDSEKNYETVVEAALWSHGYKKAKHPVDDICTLKADKNSYDYKEISKILRKMDCTMKVHAMAIYDDDCIHGTRKVVVPETVYTFAVRCFHIGTGYNWEAFEVDRKISNDNGSEDTDDTSVSEFFRERRYPDEVDFVPYYFRMFSPFNWIEEVKDSTGSKSYSTTHEKLWRYRRALEKARFLNHHAPQDLDDDYFIDRECPRSICINDDGTIDWPGEYRRFCRMIENSVCGKTLSPGIKVMAGHRCSNSVVYSGKEHGLGAFGRLAITSGDNHEMEFIVDDRKISGKQLLNLLSQYEGWTIKYEIDSN